MKKYLQNTSLTTVFGFSLFLFAVIPVTVLVSNFYFLYTQSATTDIVSRLDSFHEDISRYVQTNKSYLEEQSQALLSNRSLIFAINTKNEEDLTSIATDYLSKTSISQIEFYDEQDDKIVAIVKKDGKIITNSTATLQKLVKTYEPKLGLSISEEPALIQIKEIYENNEKIGSIRQAIVMPFSRWLDMANKQSTDVLIFTNKNRLIYSSIRDLSDEDQKRILNSPSDHAIEITISAGQYSLQKVVNENLQIFVGTNHQGYQQQLNTVALATGITLAIVLVILIPLLVLLSRWILSSLHQVTNAIVKVSEGENPQPIRVGYGKEVGVLTQSFNVMTEKLQTAQKALQDKIIELQDANQKIQEAQASMVQNAKMASLGQLVAGVAHELNNPIGFIHSNMDYLETQTQELIRIIDQDKSVEVEEWKDQSDWDYTKKDLVKAIKACKDGAARTSIIVQDLRSFSRLDRGQKDEIFVEDLIENTLKLLKTNIREDIQIKTSLARTKKVICNPNQINQVLVNLIVNAVQAIQESGEIQISTAQQNQQYAITIKDTGIGIPKEIQDRIFEPFYTTKEVGKGTGLGLSITYNIVKEHGGNISLKSNIGQGTEFVVLLPIAK